MQIGGGVNVHDLVRISIPRQDISLLTWTRSNWDIKYFRGMVEFLLGGKRTIFETIEIVDEFTSISFYLTSVFLILDF